MDPFSSSITGGLLFPGNFSLFGGAAAGQDSPIDQSQFEDTMPKLPELPSFEQFAAPDPLRDEDIRLLEGDKFEGVVPGFTGNREFQDRSTPAAAEKANAEIARRFRSKTLKQRDLAIAQDLVRDFEPLKNEPFHPGLKRGGVIALPAISETKSLQAGIQDLQSPLDRQVVPKGSTKKKTIHSDFMPDFQIDVEGIKTKPLRQPLEELGAAISKRKTPEQKTLEKIDTAGRIIEATTETALAFAAPETATALAPVKLARSLLGELQSKDADIAKVGVEFGTELIQALPGGNTFKAIRGLKKVGQAISTVQDLGTTAELIQVLVAPDQRPFDSVPAGVKPFLGFSKTPSKPSDVGRSFTDLESTTDAGRIATIEKIVEHADENLSGEHLDVIDKIVERNQGVIKLSDNLQNQLDDHKAKEVVRDNKIDYTPSQPVIQTVVPNPPEKKKEEPKFKPFQSTQVIVHRQVKHEPVKKNLKIDHSVKRLPVIQPFRSTPVTKKPVTKPKKPKK